MCFVSVHVVHPFSSTDTVTARNNLPFVLSDRSNFHMTDNLLMAFHAFALTSLSVEEILLPRYVNLSNNFRGLPLRLDMSYLKTQTVLFAFM